MNQWEHTIEIAALSIVTTQPSCFLEDQIWALLQGFGQGFVFRLRPSDSKPVLLSVLPCMLLIDIVFDAVIWGYAAAHPRTWLHEIVHRQPQWPLACVAVGMRDRHHISVQLPVYLPMSRQSCSAACIKLSHKHSSRLSSYHKLLLAVHARTHAHFLIAGLLAALIEFPAAMDLLCSVRFLPAL